MSNYYHYHNSPIGKLLLAGDGDYLSYLVFPTESKARDQLPQWRKDKVPFTDVIEQLDSYFAGELQEFDIPLAPVGTEFQHRVWDGLQEIPYGETWSYGQLARHIGKPRASRAVGAANGLNPLPIIVPCHRVIGSNGSLTGFGGGLKIKSYLLQLEAETRAPGLQFA